MQWDAIISIERTQERVVTVLDTIAQRLTQVEQALPSSVIVDQTARRVDDLERRLLEAAKPNYTALGFGLSVIAVVGGLVAFGLNAKNEHNTQLATTALARTEEMVLRLSALSGVEEHIKDVDSRLKEMVPRQEHEVRWLLKDNEFKRHLVEADAYHARNESRTDTLDARIRSLEKKNGETH